MGQIRYYDHEGMRQGLTHRSDLTVAGVQKKSFRIWIIPHTYEVTALRERKKGGAVNLEADLIGKYLEKFVGAGAQSSRSARK